MSHAAFLGRSTAKMTFQPNIGLDASTRHSVVTLLNVVLADEAVLSSKTRLAFDHSGGTNVHPVLEIHQNRISEIMAEIAERISILEGTPPGRPEEFKGLSRLERKVGANSDVLSILADHEAFIRFLRDDAQVCSEVYEDQGTFALFVSVMRQHEKMAWSLRAFIGQNLVGDEQPEGDPKHDPA